MKEYRRYCPVARACEILTDRWTLLIVREMLAGIVHFNDLQRGLPGIPRTLLAQRLDWLEQARVVERKRRPDGRTAEYHLTAGGRELQHVVDALGTWGARWAFGDIRPAELDPALLLWMMRRRIRRRRAFPVAASQWNSGSPGARPEWLWLVHRTNGCFGLPQASRIRPGPPDYGQSVNVLQRLARAASRSSTQGVAEPCRIEGDRALERNFSELLRWSPMARAVANSRPGRVADRLGTRGRMKKRHRRIFLVVPDMRPL